MFVPRKLSEIVRDSRNSNLGPFKNEASKLPNIEICLPDEDKAI
jgi:hypothetical protein